MKMTIFSGVLRDSTPRFVGPSIGPSVRHTLLFLDFWPHCSCPSDLVTSIMAPAHPLATGVAVYPASLLFTALYLSSFFVVEAFFCVFFAHISFSRLLRELLHPLPRELCKCAIYILRIYCVSLPARNIFLFT